MDEQLRVEARARETHAVGVQGRERKMRPGTFRADSEDEVQGLGKGTQLGARA